MLDPELALLVHIPTVEEEVVAIVVAVIVEVEAIVQKVVEQKPTLHTQTRILKEELRQALTQKAQATPGVLQNLKVNQLTTSLTITT
jgi:hypothetical protein